ncbi:3992_t:CDS:2, partial [Funneliformis caledonium]
HGGVLDLFANWAPIVDSALQYGEVSHVCTTTQKQLRRRSAMHTKRIRTSMSSTIKTALQQSQTAMNNSSRRKVSSARFIRRIEEQRGEEFEYCYWFCAILQESLTSTASQDPSRLFDLNYVRKAFDCEYTNSSELRSSFFRYLEMFTSTYDQDKYYSPYVTLIQASEVRKSRLLKEIGNDVFVIYSCFHESSASGGFLERSIYANNILHTEDVISTRLQWTAYLYACLQELTDAQIEYEQYWAYHQSSEAQNSIKNRTNSIFRSLENCCNKIEEEEVQLRIKTELRKHYENFVVRCKEKLDHILSKLKLVFAFNETRYLLLSAEKPIDRYYWLRIILRTLAEVQYADYCIFAVVTDTMGKLSNFAPQGKHDPSLRVQSGSHELYPLYYLLDTFNIHIRKAALEPRTLDKAAKCDYIFRFGRPLWYAQLSSAADPEYPVRLVRLAMAKLGFA